MILCQRCPEALPHLTALLQHNDDVHGARARYEGEPEYRVVEPRGTPPLCLCGHRHRIGRFTCRQCACWEFKATEQQEAS